MPSGMETAHTGVRERVTIYQPEQSVDGQPVQGTTLDNLDMPMIQRHITNAHERGRLTGSSDLMAFLQRYHVVADVSGQLIPTVAGLLMFTEEPERWLDANGVDLAQFRGERARLTDMNFIEQVRGALPTVIDRTTQILWDRTEHGVRFEGAQRIELHSYPLIVIRELTVNAIAHRLWNLRGSRVRINISPSQITWISPGELPAGITVEELLNIQYSRNPHLVQLLYQAGYIEGFGLGLDSVFDALREAKGEPPTFVSKAHTFTVSVRATPLDSADPQEESAEDRQQRIVGLIRQRGPLSISDLEEAMHTHRRTIQRDLKDLIAQGQLTVVGATTKRRYHLTDASSL